MKRQSLFGIAIIPFLVLAGNAAAQQQFCTSGPTSLSAGYDEAVGSISIKAGKTCKRAFNSNGFLPTKIVVVEQPRFGKVIVHSLTTWSYVAKAGHEGPDQFKIRYLVNINNPQTGLVTGQTGMGIRYNVSIMR